MVNLLKSELEPKHVFEFVGYQYNLLHGRVRPTQNRWESVLQKVSFLLSNMTCRVRKFMSLIGLLSNGKTGASGKASYETHSVAPQETLEGSRVTGKGDPSPKDSSPTSLVVDQGSKCLTRPTPAPIAPCPSRLYRHLKRRLGCSLRQLHSKRLLVSSRKSITHKLSGIKGCLTGPKKVPTHSTGSNCFGLPQTTLQLWHT